MTLPQIPDHITNRTMRAYVSPSLSRSLSAIANIFIASEAACLALDKAVLHRIPTSALDHHLWNAGMYMKILTDYGWPPITASDRRIALEADIAAATDAAALQPTSQP